MLAPARYLVAVDGTDVRAPRQWANDHATATQAPVLLVHVDPVHTASTAPRRPPNDGEGMIMLHGPVPEALAEFVHGDDMLVIGTDKTGFIHGRLFGSRGAQIVAAVGCSVAVIPDIDLRFRSGVVAGIDIEETTALIAGAAAAEAAARAEPLLLIHSSFTGIVAAEVSAGGSVLEAATAAVDASWPDLVVRTRSTVRPPAEALLDASRNAALLVLGHGNRAGTTLIGSVVHDVLVNINAPVLIIREPAPPVAGL